MFDVEPNEYVYGLDRNNNDEPDEREDDGEADYPYDYDERGVHLFGQWNLSPNWYLSLGHYSVKQIAGAGQSRSTYGLVGYRRQGSGWLRRIFFENNSRKVEDGIADEFMNYEDDAGSRDSNFGGRGVVYTADALPGEGIVKFLKVGFAPDLLLYQDSFVNESYFECRSQLPRGLHLVQKLRLRLNWQRGGKLPSGLFQRERRLDLWTSVTRLQFALHWGKLHITPQYKLMVFRLVDRERDLRLQSELRAIPILRLQYPLLARTTLSAGVQGLGPLPYRRRDELSRRNSFEQRAAFLTVTNRSKYFGYELVTIAGVARDRRDFDDETQRFQEFDYWNLFARALVGFTEFGRPL